MKIVGLITEYNPFHNGHLYHLQQAKAETGADKVIVVMSGDYVQRGAPAIMPKHLRTQAALAAGASLVLELPVCYATGSAEYFARGAISLLDRLHCVDAVCFGSESGSYRLLSEVADVVADEPPIYQARLKAGLKKGQPFPLARQHALNEYFQNETLSQVLEAPNNILGIEYIKALRQLNSPIKGYTIRRAVSGYHDTELSQELSSASAIRVALQRGKDQLSTLDKQVPAAVFELLETTYGTRYPVYCDDFSLLTKYRLLTKNSSALSSYADVSEELANRITNHVNDYSSYSDFCTLLKTREVTYTRISRALMHILLGITKSDLTAYADQGYSFYARVLGFRREDHEIFSQLKAKASIPLITRLSAADSLFDEAGPARRMLDQDILAANIYESVITEKYHTPFTNEYSQSMIIL